MTDCFDSDRLAQSNLLIDKWLTRLNIKKYEVYNFVKDCCDGKFDFDLSDDEIAQLKLDTQVFKYTLDVENQIIKQYSPMIYAVARRMGVFADDDFVSKGMTGIRKSVYYYAGKSKFVTFCYNGIVTAFRQVFDAVTKVQKSTVFESDLSKTDKNFYRFDTGVTTQQDSPVNRLIYLADNLDDLSQKANLNDLEKKVLISRIKECLGDEKDWINEFHKRCGLTMSKKKVHDIFKSAAKKLRSYIGSV